MCEAGETGDISVAGRSHPSLSALRNQTLPGGWFMLGWWRIMSGGWFNVRLVEDNVWRVVL